MITLVIYDYAMYLCFFLQDTVSKEFNTSDSDNENALFADNIPSDFSRASRNSARSSQGRNHCNVQHNRATKFSVRRIGDLRNCLLCSTHILCLAFGVGVKRVYTCLLV